MPWKPIRNDRPEIDGMAEAIVDVAGLSETEALAELEL